MAIYLFIQHVSGTPGTTEYAEDLLVLIVPTFVKFRLQQGRQIISTVSQIEFQTRIIIIFKKKC